MTDSHNLTEQRDVVTAGHCWSIHPQALADKLIELITPGWKENIDRTADDWKEEIEEQLQAASSG